MIICQSLLLISLLLSARSFASLCDFIFKIMEPNAVFINKLHDDKNRLASCTKTKRRTLENYAIVDCFQAVSVSVSVYFFLFLS